jgi:hypothetical protein
VSHWKSLSIYSLSFACFTVPCYDFFYKQIKKGKIMNHSNVIIVIAALVVTTLSACSIGGDYHSAFEQRKAERTARERELSNKQKGMSAAEKKAITELCMKELNNQGKGATGSINDLLAAQENCEARYSK